MLQIPGIEHDFGGGRTYIVPPLSLGALQLMQERMAALEGLTGLDPAAVDTVLEVTFLALRRNYPQITREEVGELVDVGNMGEVFSVVIDVCGIKRRALAADAEAHVGNTVAPAVILPAPAGARSSPASAPTLGGPSSTSEST